MRMRRTDPGTTDDAPRVVRRDETGEMQEVPARDISGADGYGRDGYGSDHDADRDTVTATPVDRSDDPVIVRRETTPVVVTPSARGTLSLGAILTGMLVAVGAFAIFSAIAGAIVLAVTTGPNEIDAIDTATTLGVAAGIGFLVAQFLAYMWGGYTAGRMARASGTLHGLLVPISWMLIGGITAAVVAAMGTRANFNLPWSDATFSVDPALRGEVGVGLGVLTLVVMLLGGMVGGLLGERWHRRAEHRAMTTSTV